MVVTGAAESECMPVGQVDTARLQLFLLPAGELLHTRHFSPASSQLFTVPVAALCIYLRPALTPEVPTLTFKRTLS
ncbi:hypothetical protein J6590_001074 [Homalodisca vitripennis]|nr:hypothetical protein J6590_001074 [Homalodisca vitripennis]